MTIWKPDTCECEIEYSDKEMDIDKDPLFIKVIKACKEHALIAGNDLYKAVLAHNRGFNLKYGSSPTDEQKDLIISDKKEELIRIKLK